MKIKHYIYFLSILLISQEIVAQYSPEQQLEIDSLTKRLNTAKDDTLKVDLRYQIGETGWIFRTSYWDSISNDCIKFIAQANTSEKEKKAYQNVLAATYNNTGFIFNNQGNVTQALKYFHHSLKIYEKLKDKTGIGRASNNIGLIYHEQGNIPMALKYYHKALKIREQLGDKRGVANSLNNIGFTYESQKNIPMAIMYLERSLSIYKEIDDKKGIASSSNSIGVIQQRQGNTEKAKQFHEQALKIQEEIADKDGIANSLNNLAEIALKRGEVKLAEIYANRALKLSKELGFPSPISDASKLLSEIAKKEGHYKEGWEHFEVFITMRDSIRNKETEKSVLEQEMKYEYEKISLKDSLEDAQLQAVKDLQIKEQKATIKQEQTQKYALIGGLILMIVLIIIGIKAYHQKKKDNLLINIQKQQVEEKNKEVTASIYYAKRIQAAILPPNRIIKENLPQSFILYLPKDIVAGDFYWMEQKDDKILFAAADCTGHGVPGAMVSVICNNGLNRSVREHGITEPGKILDKAREIVIAEFEKSDEDVKDGMDIALCSLEFRVQSLELPESTQNSNFETQNSKLETVALLQYAGANNPLWIIRPILNNLQLPTSTELANSTKLNFELIEIKPNKQPIGKVDNPQPFTTHTIELQKGDSIYVFSDGYTDQFGGEKGKKFKAQFFKELLLSIQNNTMEEQKNSLIQHFNNWKGTLDQVDDVCIIGVRI